MNWPTHRVPACICVRCGHGMDAATPADSGLAPPKSGDIGMCLNCGYVMIYDGAPLQLREPTQMEGLEIANSPETVMNILGMRAIIEKRNRA